MLVYTVYADPATERIDVQENDHHEFPSDVIIIDRGASYSGASGIASWHRAVLSSDPSVPFAERVRQAQDQVAREATAIYQSIADGEPTTLTLHERRHPAVLAALAARP